MELGRQSTIAKRTAASARRQRTLCVGGPTAARRSCGACAARRPTSSRSRSRSSSAAPTRACRPRSCSTRASATCSSSALPATSSRLRRSAASSSRPSAFGTRLVVVLGTSAVRRDLGHAGGAAAARRPTSRATCTPSSTASGRRSSRLLATGPALRSETLIRGGGAREHPRRRPSQLRHGSEMLETPDPQRTGCVVVGAEYSLETGIVEFFEDER